MSTPAKNLPEPDSEDTAEWAALSAAVEEALANPRAVPHEEMREWLLELSSGRFDAPKPVARIL